MTLQNCLMVVLGGNDNAFQAIEQQAATEYQVGDVVCVHTPIESNIYPTTNGLYDALTGSSLEFVVVVRESELDKAVIEASFEKFDKERTSSQKPLLRKGIGALNFEWRERYDFAAAMCCSETC